MERLLVGIVCDQLIANMHTAGDAPTPVSHIELSEPDRPLIFILVVNLMMHQLTGLFKMFSQTVCFHRICSDEPISLYLSATAGVAPFNFLLWNLKCQFFV